MGGLALFIIGLMFTIAVCASDDPAADLDRRDKDDKEQGVR